MYIYIFGSICRGEIDKYSDVDLLAVVNEKDNINSNLDTNKFSVYQKQRLSELWKEGNPFAWHLHLESKLIYTNTNDNFIQKLGKPEPYKNLNNDLNKFYNLFLESLKSIKCTRNSEVFDLSMVFLGIRNFASCFSLGNLNEYNFSRDSALKLNEYSLKISQKNFEVLERARILSTRGYGIQITSDEVQNVLLETDKIQEWFEKILKKL